MTLLRPLGTTGPSDAVKLLARCPDPVRLLGIVTVGAEMDESLSAMLAYLTSVPAGTDVTYRKYCLDAMVTAATRPRVDTGMKGTAASGKTFTIFDYRSELDESTLLRLMAANRVQFVHVEVFKTIEEGSSGGDTEEYDIKIQQADGTWQKHDWVAHVHRAKGDPRTSTKFDAAHLKRYDQRKLKNTLRQPLSTPVVAECRKVRNTELKP